MWGLEEKKSDHTGYLGSGQAVPIYFQSSNISPTHSVQTLSLHSMESQGDICGNHITWTES